MILKRFKRKSKVEITIHCIVSIIFAVVAASYLYILIWSLIAGTKTHAEIIMNPFSLPEKWHWEHYVEVFTLLEVNGHYFFDMLINSVWFSTIGVLLNQFTCITFAYCCSKYKFPGSNWPYAIILVMMALPIYGTGGATYMIMHNLGLIDSYAQIIASANGMSVMFLYYRAFFQNLSWSYAVAAMMDGAGHFQTYFKVMLPQAKPIFGALFLTNWVSSWNSYDSALLYLPNLPTLPVGIYKFNVEMIYKARLDILFAACVIVCIPALILFIVFNKAITTNVSLGGLKG